MEDRGQRTNGHGIFLEDGERRMKKCDTTATDIRPLYLTWKLGFNAETCIYYTGCLNTRRIATVVVAHKRQVKVLLAFLDC